MSALLHYALENLIYFNWVLVTGWFCVWISGLKVGGEKLIELSFRCLWAKFCRVLFAYESVCMLVSKLLIIKGCCGVASVFLTPFPYPWMKAAVRNILRYCKVLQCAYALEDETVKDYSVETMDAVTMLLVELWISILKPRFFWNQMWTYCIRMIMWSTKSWANASNLA